MRRRDFVKLAITVPLALQISCSKKKKTLSPKTRLFKRVEAKGSYRQIGRIIGKASADFYFAVREERGEWFKKLLAVASSSSGAAYSKKLKDALKTSFPQYFEEVAGMAEGLGVPFDEVWALCSKNELLSLKREEPGCSTIFYKDENKAWLFHNEDGDKSYLGRLIVAKVSPPSGVSFFSALYPGLIAGVGPSFNSFGLAQTTNYIGTTRPRVGIPRYFLGRAVLEARSLSEAARLVSTEPRAHPWHHNLFDLKSGVYLSVETIPEGQSVSERISSGIYIHTNHLISELKLKYRDEDLAYASLSSKPRFKTLKELASAAGKPLKSYKIPLSWLGSHIRAPYSPCRHPKGDIRGQTLATAFFRAGEIKMRLYEGSPCLSVKENRFEEFAF